MKSPFALNLPFIEKYAVLRPRLFYLGYLTSISAAGILLVVWGLTQIPSYEPRLNFLILVLLAAVAAFTTTSAAVSEDSGITYTIGPVIGLAAVPFFGIGAATVIFAIFNLCVWLVKPTDSATWKKSWSQLAFNTGMYCIAIVISGQVLLITRNALGADTLLGQTLPWIPAAYIFEELNTWILIGILRLQNGSTIKPLEIWAENLWSTQLGTLVAALGSLILAYAIQYYDWKGIMLFFVPTLLSAYAFRLYTRQMQAHLDNLENIVAARTQELAERTEELAELNRQKDSFLAVLTHDMITPLTSIQMYAELIQVEPTVAVENPQLVVSMLRSQKTVFELVKNILDIEKLTSGGSLTTKKVSCDLGQLVLDMVEIVRAEAEEKQLTLDVRAEANMIQIRADRQQIQRILLNLMANAIKYTPTGGNICVEVYRNNKYAVIDVADNGYGISKEELPLVFDRFKRVGQMRDKATGTGLGLAITKALVEGHNGELSVTSKLGEGSIFTVRLPIEQKLG